MATLTEISKRATAHADEYEHNHRAHFTSYLAGAIEQDRIARAEERERCIRIAADYCYKNYGTCCDFIGGLRKAIEEG